MSETNKGEEVLILVYLKKRSVATNSGLNDRGAVSLQLTQ